VVFARLAEHSGWAGYTQRRLPASQIPEPMREADANMRFVPVFELTNGQRIVRSGPHVFSYHTNAPYPGWPNFRAELNNAVDELFAKASGITVSRLGLRYINALNEDQHGIQSPIDLDMRVTIANDLQMVRVNLNVLSEAFSGADCMVKVASREFVAGLLPGNAKVVIDVDVFTRDNDFTTTDSNDVKKWVEKAHTHVKQEFFHLLKQTTIDILKAATKS
jgi:uncharacterized protein (TIGR04255 family)